MAWIATSLTDLALLGQVSTHDNLFGLLGLRDLAAELGDRVQVNDVGEGEDNLESSTIVVALVALLGLVTASLLEGNNDFKL
jgi:hypothetical protein